MCRKYKIVTENLSCDLNGEAIILNTKNGKYYGMNAVGASILAKLQQPAAFDEIQTAIMSEYNVDESVCRREILSFLGRMEDVGLIDTIDEKSS